MNKVCILLFLAFLTVQAKAQQFYFSSVKPTTCGANDGIITIVPTQGVAPFTYLWSNGSTEVSLRNIPKGVYAATITDATGSTKSHHYILNSELFDLRLEQYRPVAWCNPNAGLLTVEPLGGVAPYTYTWSNGQTGATAQNLAIGPYSVTVQDATGCTAEAEFVVPQVGNYYYPTAQMDTISAPDCGNPTNGTLRGNLLHDGFPPYLYSWSTGATTESISGLTIGEYTVTITDALGCTSAASVLLENKITATGSVICDGSNSGTVSAMLANGVSPVTYAWDNGQFGSNLSNLPGGYYIVTAIDGAGCTSSAGVYVASPTISVVDNSQKCYAGNNASAYVILQNDQGSTYNWDNGVTDSWNTTLSAGAHTITVTTSLGCTLVETFDIAPPAAPPITITTAISPANCANNLGGALNLSVSGGFQPYFVYVAGPNNFFSNNLINTNNVKGGVYYLYVSSDNAGCWTSETVTVPDASGFSPELVVEQIDCTTGFGSAAIVNVTNPTADYNWSNGASNPALFNLTEGQYDVTVTADGSCYQHFAFYLASKDSLQNSTCAATSKGQVINDMGVPGCAGNQGLQFQVVQAQPGGGLVFTDDNGFYEVHLPNGTFDLSVPQYDPADIACPVNAIHTINSVVGNTITGLDFHFLNNNPTDHRVRQEPLRTAQPGYPYSIRVDVCNDGNAGVPGTLNMEYGNILGLATGHQFARHPGAFSLSNESAGTPNNSSTFSFPAITPGECELLQLDLTTATTAIGGSQFQTRAQVLPTSGDPTPANNISNMFSGVTGSFDPNVVLAYPVRNGNPRDGGKIIRYEDNTITYQIFFQNTGNAPANQVMVYDTVDTDLNLASMRNITATHEMKIQTNADGNVLIFKFDNINLVDSTSDYASSIGSVQFDVDLKPGLDLGTKIDNTAAIFFDFNSPVITNTNVLELTSATAVHQPLSNDAVAITPNPADQYTSLYCDKACKMRLYNAVGKLISTQMLEGGLNQVNTSELPAGVYMVQLETEGAFKSGKIVVSH